MNTATKVSKRQIAVRPVTHARIMGITGRVAERRGRRTSADFVISNALELYARALDGYDEIVVRNLYEPSITISTTTGPESTEDGTDS